MLTSRFSLHLGLRLSRELYVELSEHGAEAERLDMLAGFLRDELLQLDVDDVRRKPAGEVPSGARAFDATAVGGLLVSLGQSTSTLMASITAVRSWLSRGTTTKRTVKLVLDGDVLELSEVSKPEQDRLVDLFVSRHAAGGD
jgi:hypothetical protein